MKTLKVLMLSAVAGAMLNAGGIQLNLQTSFNLGNGNAIVPNVGYSHVTATDTFGGMAPISLSTTADVFSLGADYNYFFSGKTGKGFFVLGGLGVASATLDVTGSSGNAQANTTSHQSKVYLDAGAGYQFSNGWSLALEYRDYQFDPVQVNVQGTSCESKMDGTIGLLVGFRF